MTRHTRISPAAPCIMDKGTARIVTSSSWVYQCCACILGVQAEWDFCVSQGQHPLKCVIFPLCIFENPPLRPGQLRKGTREDVSEEIN